jgi:protein PhnA
VSFSVHPKNEAIQVCEICLPQLESGDVSDSKHWQCLSEAIWSESIAVKVIAYRILSALKMESWAVELKEQIYLEESDIDWANSVVFQAMKNDANISVTKDSNGTVLNEGDSVTLIKDLDVKGAGFTAKRGTLVKAIRLTNNPEHIEGRVNGVQIVLVAKYLKKA